MKNNLFKLLSILMAVLLLTACGTSGASAETETAEVNDIAAEPATADADTVVVDESGEMASVDMLYYLQLSDSSIMAACNTDEGIEIFGEDYYVVLLNDAEIYNASGEKIALEDLTRGCPIRIEWPGMVMESYPAQIAAAKVTALSYEADPSVPAEDEIPAVGGGEKWWEPQPVTELPGMTMEYSTPDFSVAVFLSGLGSWDYTEDGEEWQSMISCGDHPLEWTYDDNNTIKRVNFDTVKLFTTPAADTMVASAYVDGSEEAVDVAIGEDGTVELLEGSEVIYVVSCFWNADTYSGDATYAFKVVVPEAS